MYLELYYKWSEDFQVEEVNFFSGQTQHSTT